MKKTSKIAPWIWRGAALLLAVYFLVAVVAGIPFLGTDIAPQLTGGEFTQTQSSVSFSHAVGERIYVNSIAFDIHIAKRTGGSYRGPIALCLAAPAITYSHQVVGSRTAVLHTDNLFFGNLLVCGRCMGRMFETTTVIGLRSPKGYTHEGDLVSGDGYVHYIRSYSSPMLPVIDTGSTIWGMLLLTAIPILLSFVYSRFCGKVFSGDQKAVLYRGAKVKLVVAVCMMALFSATALFYLPRPNVSFVQTVLFPLIRWLTPIISIPALSVWVASFKNKKFAPAFAAAIMALCLYQPLANLICLFATVIAWGYFAHGVCRFFGRFRKAKSEAV